MASRLLFVNSAYNVSTPAQLLAANLVMAKYPDVTVKDINAVTTGDITTYIGTLSADTYTDIFVSTTVQTVGATGLLSYDQVGSLRAKMITASKGTTVRANTCQANAVVTSILLDASASAVDDTYNDMYIVTAGVTAVSRYITNYTGISVTATVATTVTAITATETFIIYTQTNIYLYGNIVAATAKNAGYNAWNSLWPSTPAPLLVVYTGGYKSVQCSGTATAVAAGTITLDATGATRSVGDVMPLATMIVADAVADMWVYVYSATIGAWQSRKITASAVTTAVCTLESNWDVTPTGTVVYRVVSDVDKVRADRALEIYIKANWSDVTNAQAKSEVHDLINYYGDLDENKTDEPSYDRDLLAEAIKLGSFAFKADASLYI